MNIYVGNLSFDTTEQGLRAVFGAHGKVSDASIIKDRSTGRSRGFGFVEMPSRDEAQAAMKALHGSEIDGQVLIVNEARERRDGRGGSGGRGGGRC